jgi:hypothetical protein
MLPRTPHIEGRELEMFSMFANSLFKQEAEISGYDAAAAPEYSPFAWKTLKRWRAGTEYVRSSAMHLARVRACDRRVEHADVFQAIRAIDKLVRAAKERCRKWP